MNDTERAAFEARFHEACTQMLLNLTPEQRAEIELFAATELDPLMSSTAYPDRVEVRAAGLPIGAVSVAWLQTGRGVAILRHGEPS